MRWKERVLEGVQERHTALGVGGLLALLLSAFGIFGLWSGYAVVLLADLSGALDLSPGPLSVALLIGTMASLAAMPALGWTADRLGRKVFLAAVTCVWGTGIAGLALAGDFWTLVLVLLFLSPSTGLLHCRSSPDQWSATLVLALLAKAYRLGCYKCPCDPGNRDLLRRHVCRHRRA